VNGEREVTRAIEAWLAEPEPPLDDHVIDTAIDRLPHTPQRRRWWPFRWFPFGIGATRSTNSSGPRPYRRSSSMLTATRSAAVIAILALSGSLALVAGPLGSSPDTAPAPGAVTPSPSPASSDGTYFTGTMRYGYGMPNASTVGDDGVARFRDVTFEVAWESTDPRFSGSGETTNNSNVYRTDSGDEVTAGWGTQTLKNEAGVWRSAGPGSGVNANTSSRFHQWFSGEGDFEGLTAYVVYDIQQPQDPPYYWDYEGWIVPGDAHLTEMYE
jgi:hypothetical protein